MADAIYQQLWSLECSVVETVMSLLHGVMEHCLAGIQSHCPDKVDDIQAVMKSSTDQSNSLGHLFVSLDLWKTSVFCSKKLWCLPSAFSRIGISNVTVALVKESLFDKLISAACLLHPVFLSDVLSDVVVMTSNYSADNALSNCQTTFA